MQNNNKRYTLATTGMLSMFAVLATLSSQNVAAACKNKSCACQPSELQFASPTAVAGEDGKLPLSLEADNVEAQGKELVTLSGNAEISQGRQTIVADTMTYYRDSDRVKASGDVEIISKNGDYFRSESIDVHAPTHVGEINNAQFKLAKGISSEDGIDTVQIESRGTADKINLEGEGFVRLENASYTTCPEGNDDVIIRAKELELDEVGNVGVARNATVRFMGLPIFYTPYISFPLNDERKTGFLTPGFGSDEDSGNIFELPWYWNIAPNQDATITPRLYTDRGLQLAGEYRHKSENSNTFVYGEVLREDDLFNDDRDMISIQHENRITDNLTAQVNYNDVSDTEYFDDFRNEVKYFSATYVPRDASLRYNADYYRLNLRVNEYQIVDDIISEENKPYERLPEFTFNTFLPEGPYGIRADIEGGISKFASDFRVEGTRTALSPSVKIPFENIWGYVTPKVTVNYRDYSLDNVTDGGNENPSFTVPIFSLDTGIYLEKNTSWFGSSAYQTLEPRLFYVYAPEEDQDDVPIFDTSAVSLNNFSGIFRENRFYGQDRVGDTNQVTLGLTTRITDNESGDQLLKASIGQLYLLSDQEQTLLADQTPTEKGLGDLLAEVSTESGAWTTYAFAQYDHDESEIRSARFDIGYEPVDDDRKQISLGYYFSNSISGRDVDQITFSGTWPISDRWQLFGSERYSLEDSDSIETTLGAEYDSCCWKLRFTAQDRITNNNIDDKKQSFFVELELTSLGRIRTGL